MRLFKLSTALIFCAALWESSAHADNLKVCVKVTVREAPESAAATPVAEPKPGPAPAPAAPSAAFGPPSPPAEGDLSGLTEEQRLVVMTQRIAAVRSKPAPAPVSRAATPALPDPLSVVPPGQSPIDYLKRLMEHFVTHEPGFVAVAEGCQQRIEIELYPLVEGWAVFTSYSGTGREERVDRLLPDELSRFAERAVLALLHGRPISTTILRDTVLRADSKPAAQRVRGTHHVQMSLGTVMRGGFLPTSLADGSGDVEDQLRVFSPMTLAVGYRGKFESWGLSTNLGVGIGTSKTGVTDNSLGGHIDYGGNVALQLHFLRYLKPRGLTSVYLGAGSTFEVLWLNEIRPQTQRSMGDRNTLVSGGLNVDLVFGVEFMRASKAQFFLQGVVHLPAYVVNTTGVRGDINTWLPGIGVQLGMMF